MKEYDDLYKTHMMSGIVSGIITVSIPALLLWALSCLYSCSPAWHLGDPDKKQKLQNWHDEKEAMKYENIEKKSTQRF